MTFELDGEAALVLLVLKEAKTPVTYLGGGCLNDSLSSLDVESPIRWGKEAACSGPWVDPCADGCVVSFVRFFRYIATNTLAFYLREIQCQRSVEANLA